MLGLAVAGAHVVNRRSDILDRSLEHGDSAIGVEAERRLALHRLEPVTRPPGDVSNSLGEEHLVIVDRDQITRAALQVVCDIE